MPKVLSRLVPRLALVLGALLGVSRSTQAAPPPNDDFDQATVIQGLPFTDTVDVTEATAAPDDPFSSCGFPSGVTVWYAFTPGTTVRLEAAAGYVSTIHVLTGTRGALTEVACSSFNPPSTSLRFTATAGVSYHVMVRVYTTPPVPAQVVFSLSEAPPPPDNDEIEGARVIGGLPFDDTVDTAGASTAPDDPFCSGQGPTVWYSFTPSVDVRIELTANSGAYLPTLSAYTGARGSLAQVGCSAFNQGGPGARLRFDAQAGVTYYVMVGALFFQSSGGLTTLSARVAPPPFAFAMQVNATGSVTPSTGAATISGTATCSEPAFVSGSGVLRQDRPGQPIDGYVFTSFLCDGVTPWTAVVSYSPRLFNGRSAALFVGGPAQVTLSAQAFAFSEGEFRFLSVSKDLMLTGGTPRP